MVSPLPLMVVGIGSIPSGPELPQRTALSRGGSDDVQRGRQSQNDRRNLFRTTCCTHSKNTNSQSKL